MAAPGIREIVDATLRNRGIAAEEGQIARVVYAADKALTKGVPAMIDALEVEIAALDRAHMDALIQSKAIKLEQLRNRRAEMA